MDLSLPASRTVRNLSKFATCDHPVVLKDQCTRSFYATLSDGIDIPVMIQDAPESGTVLSAAFLARIARKIEQVSYFKIEKTGVASKLREPVRLGRDAIEGPWDGEEAITLKPDLYAGATGAMCGGGCH